MLVHCTHQLIKPVVFGYFDNIEYEILNKSISQTIFEARPLKPEKQSLLWWLLGYKSEYKQELEDAQKIKGHYR